MKAVLFIIFMTAALGLSLWFPVLLPVAIGGLSLYIGLAACRHEVNRCNSSVVDMVASSLVGFVVLIFMIYSAFQFPAEYSGELFCRDILPFLSISFR